MKAFLAFGLGGGGGAKRAGFLCDLNVIFEHFW